MSAPEVAAWLRFNGFESQTVDLQALCTPELAPLWTFLLSGGLEPGYGDQLTKRGVTLENKDSHKLVANRTVGFAEDIGTVEGAAKGILESEHTSATSAAEAQLKLCLYNSYLAGRSQLMEVISVYCNNVEEEIAKAGNVLAKAEPGVSESTGKEFIGAVEADMKRQLSKIVSAGNLSDAEISWDDAKQAAKLALSEADSQGCPPGLVWACVEQSEAALKAITAALSDVDLVRDAEDLSRLPAFQEHGLLDSEQLLHAARQEHVRLFSKATVAGAAQRDAKQKLETLQANLNRLCAGSQAGTNRKRLLMLLSDIAGNREAVRILELEMADLKKQKAQQAIMEQALKQTKEDVVKTRMRNVMLDAIIHSLVTNAAGFLGRWAPNVASNKANLSNMIQPHATILPGAAQDAASKLAAESAAVGQAPLHLLGNQKAPGQDWGQRTPAQQTKKAKHLVEQLAGLNKGLALLREAKELANLSPAAKLSAAYSTFMQHITSRTEDLQMLESTGRQSLLRGQTVVMEVLHEWWDQPAINAMDWIKLEGRNAKEWLLHMRTLHAALQARSANGC